MIDNSASMTTTDVLPNRLEVAKAEAKKLIREMGTNDVAMVIAFSDRADVRQGFTGDRNRLLKSIDSIPPSARTTDLNEAMRAAAGLANPGRVSFDGMNDIQVAEALPATVSLFSDGGFSSLSEFSLGNLSVRYIPIGTAAIDNVAIEAFSILRNEERPDEVEAYARVVSYCLDPIESTASLYLNDTLVDAVKIQVAPGKESGVMFDLKNVDVLRGVFRMVLDRDDQMMVDNIAYAATRPTKPSNVLLVTPGNKPLVTALNTAAIQAMANVDVVETEILSGSESSQQLLQRTDLDLIIFDQCTPLKMPMANTLFIGGVPPQSDWIIGKTSVPINLIDLDRTHPMMEFLELNSVRIVEGHSVTPPPGGKVLIRADNGPVFAIAPRGPYQDAVLGFAIVRQSEKGVELNTNWGINRSFPLFVFAAVDFLSGVTTQQAASSTQPGQPVQLSLSNRYQTFEVIDPSGTKSILDMSPSGQYIYTSTDAPGAYYVKAQNESVNTLRDAEKDSRLSMEERQTTSTTTTDKLVEIFTANLFSPRESNVATLKELSIGGEEVVGLVGKTVSRTEYWRWLLLFGIGMLVTEWFVFHRRSY